MAKTDDPAAKAAEQQEVAAIKAALEPLARISPQGQRRAAPVTEGVPAEFTGSYQITRGRRTVTLTGAEIRAARACLAQAEVTVAACRSALRPFARLPRHPDAADDSAAYEFAGDDGQPVTITNRMIDQAAELSEA
jgi:hypothetical protein